MLWDYHRLGHELRPADLIRVLCSYDLRVADRAAEVFHAGYAPRVLFSGNVGDLTRGLWADPEAVVFARRAVELGVPDDHVLVEPQSTNTGENVRFSRELLAQRGIAASTLIVVQKPYMERRSYATCKQVWPEAECIVTSPRIPFDEYVQDDRDFHINVMVGDLQRLRIYGERGFQIPQEIPPEVWGAFEELVSLGYDRHLVGC